MHSHTPAVTVAHACLGRPASNCIHRQHEQASSARRESWACKASATAEAETQEADTTSLNRELATRLDAVTRQHRHSEVVYDPAEPESMEVEPDQHGKKVSARRSGAREQLSDTPVELLPKVRICSRRSI